MLGGRGGDPVQQAQDFPQIRAVAPSQQRGNLMIDAHMGLGKAARLRKRRLLRHQQESGGERIFVELAAGLHHAAVLCLVAQAIELVQDGEHMPTSVRSHIAFAGRDADARDQHAAAESSVRQMARQVERDPAARAAAEAEDDADDRVTLRGVGARGKAPQGLRHGTVAAVLGSCSGSGPVVISLAVDRLGQCAWHRFAGSRYRQRGVEPRPEFGIALQHRVFEFEKTAVVLERPNESGGVRKGQLQRLDVCTVGRKFRGQRLHAGERARVIADVDGQRRQPGTRGAQQVIRRVAQHLLDDLCPGPAHADDVNAVGQRVGIGDAVHAAPQRVELALLQLRLRRSDGVGRTAAQKIDPSC